MLNISFLYTSRVYKKKNKMDHTKLIHCTPITMNQGCSSRPKRGQSSVLMLQSELHAVISPSIHWSCQNSLLQVKSYVKTWWKTDLRTEFRRPSWTKWRLLEIAELNYENVFDLTCLTLWLYMRDHSDIKTASQNNPTGCWPKSHPLNNPETLAVRTIWE